MNETTYRKILDEAVYSVGNLCDEDCSWYSHQFKGLEATGETLIVDYPDGQRVVLVVFKGSWTPSGGVRDCGKYYIRALYSRYIKIDKATLRIIDYDCND